MDKMCGYELQFIVDLEDVHESRLGLLSQPLSGGQAHAKSVVLVPHRLDLDVGRERRTTRIEGLAAAWCLLLEFDDEVPARPVMVDRRITDEFRATADLGEARFALFAEFVRVQRQSDSPVIFGE